MKITITATANARELTPQDSQSDASVLNGFSLDHDLVDYMDQDMIDLGICGGNAKLAIDSAGKLQIAVDFWSPRRLDEALLDRLREDVRSQLEDGFGEGGFQIALDDRKFDVQVDDDESLTAEQGDDGQIVPEASPVVRAARDGDLAALQAAVHAGADINARLAGYTALQMAILYGHLPEALWLLKHNADVHAVTRDGDTCLRLCATASDLDDAASTQIARELLVRGVDRNAPDKHGSTAAMFAKNRKKVQLATFLEEK